MQATRTHPRTHPPRPPHAQSNPTPPLHTMIRLRVRSLKELREKHQAGDYVSGTVFSTQVRQ